MIQKVHVVVNYYSAPILASLKQVGVRALCLGVSKPQRTKEGGLGGGAVVEGGGRALGGGRFY